MQISQLKFAIKSYGKFSLPGFGLRSGSMVVWGWRVPDRGAAPATSGGGRWPAPWLYVKCNTVNMMNHIVERATITVVGMVQGVGFRYKVRASATSLGIKGYVKNLEDDTVEIVAEGSRQDIESPIQNMRGYDEPVVVKDVRASYQKATGEFKSFNITIGDMVTEMVEGFATYNMHFEISLRKQDEIISEIRRSTDHIVGKQDQMLDKQDQMLDKQDQTIATIQGCSDKMLDKQDQTTSEVRTLSNNLAT